MHKFHFVLPLSVVAFAYQQNLTSYSAYSSPPPDLYMQCTVIRYRNRIANRYRYYNTFCWIFHNCYIKLDSKSASHIPTLEYCI